MKVYQIVKIEEWRDFWGHDSSRTVLPDIYKKKPELPKAYSYVDAGNIDTDVYFEIIEKEII